MFPSVRRRRRILAAAISLLLAAPAAAAAGQAEQFNRTDGVAGIAPYASTSIQGTAVSDDGRYVYFVFFAGIPQWAGANGLWRRDVLENRTKLITSANDVTQLGLSSDGTALGFVTRRALVADDKNTLADVYRFNTSTGALELASRVDGTTGTAAGLYGDSGLLTRSGRAAVFQTADGVFRRDLAAGKTVRLGAGPLGDSNGWLTTQSVSADGSVYVSGKDLVTPSGRVTLLTGDGRSYVNESGSWALATTYGDPPTGTAYNVATGERRTITIAAREYFYGLAPSGLIQISAGSGYATIDPATGAGTQLPAGAFVGYGTSHNGKYGVASTNVGQNFLAFLVPTADATIPGGVDLPSATGYVTFIRGCAPYPLIGGGRSSTVGAEFGANYVPLAKSVNLKAYLPNGTKVGEVTFTKNGTVPVSGVGTGPWKLTATITLADGRVLTETQDMAPIGATNYCSYSL